MCGCVPSLYAVVGHCCVCLTQGFECKSLVCNLFEERSNLPGSLKAVLSTHFFLAGSLGIIITHTHTHTVFTFSHPDGPRFPRAVRSTCIHSSAHKQEETQHTLHQRRLSPSSLSSFMPRRISAIVGGSPAGLLLAYLNELRISSYVKVACPISCTVLAFSQLHYSWQSKRISLLL